MKHRNIALVVVMVAVLLVSCSAGGTSLKSIPAVSAILPQPASTTTQTAPVPSAAVSVNAEGHIVPRDSASLAFNRSGKLAEVLVKEGQVVKAGQVLARLGERETLDATVKAAELAQLTAQQAVDDLNRDSSQVYAQALQAVANARKALDDTQDRRDWLNGKYGSKSQIAEAKANLILLDDTIDNLQSQYDEMSSLSSDDIKKATVKANLEKYKQKRVFAKYSYDWLNSNVDAKDVAIADANLAKAKADLKTAVDAAQRRQNGPDTEQLALAQANLANTQAQLVAAQKAVSDLDLLAPYDGTIVQVNFAAGELVTPTQPVILFADLANLYVETSDLTELKVVKIDPTKPILVSPDAIPGLKLPGHIELIRDNYVDKSGDIMYVVRVHLDHFDPRLKWGMTVNTEFGGN